jgi:hypothetical protein
MNPLPLLLICFAIWVNRHQQVFIDNLEERLRVLDEQLGKRQLTQPRPIRTDFSPILSMGDSETVPVKVPVNEFFLSSWFVVR